MLIATLSYSYSKFKIIYLQRKESVAKSDVSSQMLFTTGSTSYMGASL